MEPWLMGSGIVEIKSNHGTQVHATSLFCMRWSKQDYLVWFKNSYSYLERGVGGPHFKARSGPICLAASPGSCRPKAYYGWVKRSLAPSIHLFCQIHHKNKRKRKRSDIDQVALAQAISPYTHTFFDRYPRLLLLSLAIPAVPAIAPAIDLSIPPFPREKESCVNRQAIDLPLLKQSIPR